MHDTWTFFDILKNALRWFRVGILFQHELCSWTSQAGGGDGGRVQCSEKLGRGRPPRFGNEVAQIRYLFRLLGYFGVGWPHY